VAPKISIRRRARANGSLTAAGQRIVDPSKTFKSTTGSRDDDGWQEKGWFYLEHVGELRYYVGWRGASVSRCRLVASDIDPISGRPTGSTENEVAQRIVRDIAGGANGQAQMLKRMTISLTVPGESFVAMILRDPVAEAEALKTTSPLESILLGTRGPYEDWVTLTRDEVKSSSNKLEFTLADGIKHTYNPETDLFFRSWNPHPRRAVEADSPVRSSLDILSEIVRTSATIDNAAKSRLVGNGIVFVPQEMSLPAQAAPGATPVGAEPPAPGAPAWTPANSQDLQDLLYEVASVAVKDQNAMAAFIPIIAAAPGEWIKNVTHLKFDSTVSETALKTREAAIRRLAMSLDVAPERLLGMGSNSNHWSAWAIGEDDVKVHVIPVLETICDSLNEFIFRDALAAEGLDPDMFTVWYDTTELTQDPDKKEAAKDAYDRGQLTGESLMDYLGFDASEGYDLSTKEGWIQLARDKAASDITLLPLLAPLIGALVGEVASTPAQPAVEPAPSPTPPEEEDAPAPEAEPQEEPDPADEPDSLPAAAYGLAKMCVNRALELANKRRRTRSNHALFDQTPVHRAHVQLGGVTETEARKLIGGWDDLLDTEMTVSVGMDPVKFTAMVERTAVFAITNAVEAELSDSQMFAARS
jgi:hypothetical protein